MQSESSRRLKWQMFALSFAALFLELMVIRWVPSVVRVVAYYANLMLLSSFLGLGVGAMLAGRKWRIFDWFPVFLAGEIVVMLLCRDAVLGTSTTEARFNGHSPALLSNVVLVGIFAANTLLFVPLGQQMGTLFTALPRLPAYAWDLGGSLCGTLCFGWFSLQLFSPVLGMGVVMFIYLLLSPRRRWVFSAPLFAALLLIMVRTGDSAAIWSPYYHIRVTTLENPGETVSTPPPDLLTMHDPPVYGVMVNRFGYHLDAALDPKRYTPGTFRAVWMLEQWEQYHLPYMLCPGRKRVLVVGAGGGADVQAALSMGVEDVDAVEIDPVIVQLSRRFNAGAPYADSRVHIHVDDARSFIARAAPGYDLVVFGFLDSQALFSSKSNVRLDGFVYTVESLRQAYSLVKDRGMLSLSFCLGRLWLAPKLFQMIREATGQEPLMYLNDRNMIFCVPKGGSVQPPPSIFRFKLFRFDQPPDIDVATDDWPYLYLSRKTIPNDYLVVIGSLLALSLAAVGSLRRRAFGWQDVFFAFLGMGFMLLETKGISDCTLFFGTTWLVTMIVVAGVLVMVLGANLVAERLPRFSYGMYFPLFALLLLLYFVPREHILTLDFTGRLLWTLLAVPLPVFFAGLIFSTTFRDSTAPSALFGANLVGAMAGGFSEYLGMALGSHHLSLLVIIAYVASLLALLGAKKAGALQAA